MPLACVENTEEKQRAPGGSQNCVLCSSLFTAVLLSIGQFKELRVEDDTTMISSEIKIVYLARDDDHLHYEGLKNSHEQKLLKMRKETVFQWNLWVQTCSKLKCLSGLPQLKQQLIQKIIYSF